MGRASRLKRERREGGPVAPTVTDLERAIRIQENATKRWDRAILRKLLPEGEEPVATRYDPIKDVIHIACQSGKVVAVGRGDLMRLELDAPPVGGGLPPGMPPPTRAVVVSQQIREFEKAWREYQDAKRREQDNTCRCAPPGQGDPDAEPCPQHPQGGGRDHPQPEPTDFLQQWEMAEARLAEAKLAGEYDEALCASLACPRTSEVLLRDVFDEDEVIIPESPRCAECARAMIKQYGVNVLDWNPEG